VDKSLPNRIGELIELTRESSKLAAGQGPRKHPLNSRGTNRNDFIRHELLQVYTWTTLMASTSTSPARYLSKMVQHFFGVANEQMKSGGRVVVMEANENPRHKIPRHSCAGRQSQSPIHFVGPIQLPPNLFEFGKDVLNSFPKMSASLG
jgi:hypothetical protein